MNILISVINHLDVRFNVHLVKKGERYGLVKNGVPCLVHEDEDPLVEFYDARYPNSTLGPCAELGQFVSRYNRSTLLAWPKLDGRGLALALGVEEWVLDPPAALMVVRALK